MQGIQIAGLANVTAKATGILIAPINRIDSLNGCLPIGLITIVKKGRLSQIEFGASDLMHAQVSFRYGARKWYNIYSVGTHFSDANRWGYGFGFGSQWYLNSSQDIFTNIEATTFHINEGEWWTDNVNLNNTLRVAVGKQFGQWQIFAAANLNTLVSNYNDGETFAPAAPDNTLYSYEPDSGAHVRMWVGATVGVRYVFSKN